MKKRALLAGLLFPLLASAQAPLQVSDIKVPEHLAWGTNDFSVDVLNPDATERRVSIDVQTRVEGSGGVGWQTVETIAAGQHKHLERDLFFRAIPGAARARITVTDAQTGGVLASKTLTDDFPISNPRRNAVRITNQQIWKLSDASIAPAKESYPPLQLRNEGRFSFYLTQGDDFAAQEVPKVARQREEVVAQLEKLLNTRLNHGVGPISVSRRPYKVRLYLAQRRRLGGGREGHRRNIE